MNTDDNLKELFSRFEPELAPDYESMNRLRKNLERVEFVKRECAVLRRRNRLAVVVAALAGFAAGVGCTLLFPILSSWLAGLSLPSFMTGVAEMEAQWHLVGWIVSAAAAFFTAMATYDSAISRASINV